MTDVERWQRIEDVFHQVADMTSGPAKAQRVRELCAGEGWLVDAVEALLAEDAWLQQPDETSDPRIGSRLGAYAIDALIARGGMAAVYAAHRADKTFEQRVAVKVMEVRLADPALVAQFKDERQILASLEHPAITRLLDGGVTAAGEPYLVMEYVDGVPIDRYCDDHRVALADRVRLFAEVCDGVTYAHRSLVLHRDLKPSNILVSAAGRVKIVDFGTATLLQPTRLATVSRAPFTPAYASPEQLTGQAVGIASDQYSLGLVLYELATGARAFGHDTSLIASVERALAGTSPAAPHTTVGPEAAAARQTSPARLRRRLSGDLGTIIRKTLAAEPGERYASIQHLADDLARWGEGAPILGRTSSLAYVATRFVRRHWISTSVATILALALVAMTGVSVRQAAAARRQADEARRQEALALTESGKARQLNRFLTRMLSSANPTWTNPNAGDAGTMTVRQVLEGASQIVGTELGGQPDVEAEMRRTLARTYIGLGLLDLALPHMDRAFELFTDQGDEGGVASVEMLFGTIRMRRGDYAAAEERFRAARHYLTAHPQDADPELVFISTSDLSTVIGYQRPGSPEAIELGREAIAVADRNGITAGVALAINNVASLLYRAGRVDEAEAAYLDSQRRMEALSPSPPEIHVLRANLANLMRITDRAAEAERLGASAAEGATRAWPAAHSYHAHIKQAWGRALVAVGQAERGRDQLLEALALLRTLRPSGHADLAGPLTGLGGAYRALGLLDRSEQVLREARTLLESAPRLKDRAGDAAFELALTLRAQRRAGEAERVLLESLLLFQAAYGDQHPLTRRALASQPGEAR